MQPCPRSIASFRSSVPSFWREDRSCSYCGSIHPDDFFAAIEAGSELGPTDKDYKVYIDRPNPLAGKLRIVSSANNKPDYGEWIFLTAENFAEVTNGFDPKDMIHAERWCMEHWVQIGKHADINQDKFYFYHLSDDQKKKFVVMLNDKKIKIAYPGYFYVLPYFCVRVPIAAN
jgi:hypothetical protein